MARPSSQSAISATGDSQLSQVIRSDQLLQVGHHFPLIALEWSKERLVSRRELGDRFKGCLPTMIGEPNLIGARIFFG
jgi:hypothetical protein